MQPPFRHLLVAVVALSALVGASPGGSVPDASTAVTDPRPVIVELTTAPAARAVTTGAAAAAQRARVRRAILDLESRARATRGLAAPRAAEVLRHEYRVVANGFAAELFPETIRALASNPDVKRVVDDGRVEAILDVSVPHVRAPEVWSDFGYRGAGVTIAIIDTGIDYTHPDLGGCLGPGCKVIGGYDVANDDSDPMDDNGHGTHVAATAAGDGVLVGVAPDAHLLAYKVLDNQGFGSWSTVIAGIERAADPDGNGNPSDHADIISMSLGGQGDEDDPVSTAIDAATAAGVLSVIAAGNSARHFTIGSPGTARTALTVGATDDLDQIAIFSSRGPTISAALLKPEITAPGVGICAARLPGAYAGRECIDTAHAQLSGTSMATPHVAGAAALLRGLVPSLSPAEAKAILQEAAVPVGLDATTGGAGRLDVRAAMDIRTVLVPAPVNLGIDDGVAATWQRTAAVTLRNLSATAKDYTLAFDGTGLPAGVTASVVPDEVSVPADGATEVTLTLTVDNAQVPPSKVPPYLYTGRLVASAPGEERGVAVSFALQPPLPNDLCEQAIEVGPGTFGASALVTNATSSPDDPVSSCGCGANANSLWYRVTPSQSGTVHVNAEGSSYLTVLSAFTGHCGTLHAMGCDDFTDDQKAHLTFEAKAGTSYYVEVASLCDAIPGRLALEFIVPGLREPVVEPFTEVFRTNTGDLAGTSLVFTPAGASYSTCLGFARDYPTDPAGGTVLPLTGNSFAAIPLADGATVALHGQHYDELFIGSNGYVTFTAGEVEFGPSFLSHFGLPTVAPFSAEFIVGPHALGKVSWKQLSDRVTVTWDRIQSVEPDELFAYPYNRLQLELFFDGVIRMTFLETGWHGLTGLSPGGGAPDFFPTSNFVAVRHCRAPAGGEVPLEGKRLAFRTGDTPQASKVKTVLGRPNPAELPQPGGVTDPTLAGGAFELYNPQTGEFTAIPLPAAGWSRVSGANGSIAYQYRDGGALHGPCSAVNVGARGIRAKCGRAALGFTLDESGQQKLATSLTLGSTTTGVRFCSVFGGKIRKDLPGAFMASKASTPERCWLPESYYP